MNILGLSWFFHDSAAALVQNGRVVAATHEERYTRVKHDWRFPANAVKFCLKEAGLKMRDIDCIVHYELPKLRAQRILRSLVPGFPNNRQAFHYLAKFKVMPLLAMKKEIRRQLNYDGPVQVIEHHLSHAASAFYCSPFDEAAVLTVDGVGEWATATLGEADRNGIRLFRELHFPHSLGLMYTVMTEYTGFKPNSGEYKVMGLAPYGEPVYLERLLEIAPIAPDGSIFMDMRYFTLKEDMPAANERFHDKLGGPPRQRDGGEFTSREYDLAASIQKYTELSILRMCQYLAKQTDKRNLVMAGGVALNCTANSKIVQVTPFKNIFIQPGAGDAGGAIGCALHHYHRLTRQPNSKRPFSPYLGDRITINDAAKVLEKYGAKFERLDQEELCRAVAKKITEGRVVGWAQGAMEFGPRALGSRSILADPRDPNMKDHLNEAIKLREGFRPFAPSVMKERAAEVFDIPQEDCDYMLFVADVKTNGKPTPIPAVTHVDGSARLQTVDKKINPLYHGVISEFDRLTGVPVIINTSFNVRGEPIVRTPFEAYRCFMATGIDDLAVGPFLLSKEDQTMDSSINYLDELEPD